MLGKLGRNTEAVASYDKALGIDPNITEAIQNRKIALEQQSEGQPTSATPIQQQTKTTPLLYAPIGAIVLTIGIAVLSRRRDPSRK